MLHSLISLFFHAFPVNSADGSVIFGESAKTSMFRTILVHLRKFVVFKKVRITLLTLVALRNYPPPDLLLLCVSGGSKSVEYSQKTMEDTLKKVEEMGADLGGNRDP